MRFALDEPPDAGRNEGRCFLTGSRAARAAADDELRALALAVRQAIKALERRLDIPLDVVSLED